MLNTFHPAYRRPQHSFSTYKDIRMLIRQCHKTQYTGICHGDITRTFIRVYNEQCTKIKTGLMINNYALIINH